MSKFEFGRYFIPIKRKMVYKYYENLAKKNHKKYKNNEYKLTVILTAYNQVDNISKTIESIIMQKTNFKYKLVIADDCSTDGTSNIVRAYASKYPNLIFPLIREKNIGYPYNHFYTIKDVDTEYYCLIEADDYYTDPNKLQVQIDILDNNFDCVYCSHTVKVFNNKSDNITFKNNALIGNIGETGKYVKAHWTHTLGKMYRSYITKNLDVKKSFFICDGPVCFFASNFGKLFFIKKDMAIYNFTGKGVYSSLSQDGIKIRGNLVELVSSYLIRGIKYIPKKEYKKRFDVNRLKEELISCEANDSGFFNPNKYLFTKALDFVEKKQR